MAAFREKKVSQKKQPLSPEVTSTQNPETVNRLHPSWCFSTCDKLAWTFTAEDFMQEILPKLKEWETCSWNELLIRSKKENHSVDTAQLNKIAKQRLDELHLEANAIVSLRLQGTHRLYGYRIAGVFYILWFDTNHGDNDTCVCRSRKKHT